ncbi:MAG: sterol desaturase [Caulobacter sp.]|nr:sterol desaturase [Caulobacter sp.]
MKLDPVTLAIPFFIISILLEILLSRLGVTKANYEVRDTATSLMMGFFSSIIGAIPAAAIFGVSVWVYKYRLLDIPMVGLLGVGAWAALFLLEDLTYYWFHRLSHERRFWWAAHVNHHTSQHYNLSTALRQTWTGGVSGTWLLWLPLSFIGFPPAMVAIQKGISLVYQYWIHTEVIRRLPGPIEAVFNTPSHHRVHHARNPRYLDANYAGILIIWDRLFGTFIPEDDAEPCRYGTVKNLGDFNLLRVAFHEWIGIGQDLARSRSPREVLGYLFGPPGWSPDGSRDTSHTLKAKWQARQAAQAQASAESAPMAAE